MDLNQYVEDATKTESRIPQVVVNPDMLLAVLMVTISANQMLDQIKKHAFYGREYNVEAFNTAFSRAQTALNKLQYVPLGVDDLPFVEKPLSVNSRVFHSLVGISTESGELLEQLYSALHGRHIDTINTLEEFGDVNWYVAIGLDVLNGDFEQVLTTNIDKLRARFPNAFDSTDANERDLDKERKILEDGMGDEPVS
jgi:NTP pyrophosphatase (non-canonical NTP hydrolase)